MLFMQHRLEQRDLLFYPVGHVMVLALYFNMFLKWLSFGSQEYTKKLKVKSVQIFWARLASFSHLGLVNDPLMVSKFHRLHTVLVPVTSSSEAIYVLKGYPFYTDLKTHGHCQLWVLQSTQYIPLD